MKRKAMETENKPVFILLARRFRPLTENSPAQRDSIMSNGRLSVASCWPHGQSSPAQRDSGIYKLGAGRAGLTSLTSLTEPQCASAQRDSEMSILAELLKTAPAQRDSIMSALGMGLIGPMGPMGPIGLMGQKPGIKNAPAQWDSEISILGMGLIGPMGPIGLMGNKPGMKNAPAQRDSGNSIFGSMGQQPIKNSPAQLDSKMSNGLLSGMPCWPHGQSSPAQRDSKISNLKNSPYCPSCPLVFKTALYCFRLKI